ncbi:MAG TPA: hypothetical protein PKY59_19950 [Pyrinomonadaceae bacterium]|nr:hypothetical protein [Pyrinomonadaceae bacterium]
MAQINKKETVFFINLTTDTFAGKGDFRAYLTLNFIFKLALKNYLLKGERIETKKLAGLTEIIFGTRI